MLSEGLFQGGKILLCHVTVKLVQLLKQKRAVRYKDMGVSYTIQGEIIQYQGKDSTLSGTQDSTLPGSRIRNGKARKIQGIPLPNVSGILALFFSAYVHFSFSSGQLPFKFLQSSFLSMCMINIELLGFHVFHSTTSIG